MFIDTSAWVALVSTDDINHTQIKQIIDLNLKKRTPLFTSNYVFCETITRLNTHASWFKTAQFIELFDESLYSKTVRRFWIDKKLEGDSLKFLAKYSNHRFSLTDATIAVLVKTHQLDTILTTDGGFNKIGFKVLP